METQAWLAWGWPLVYNPLHQHSAHAIEVRTIDQAVVQDGVRLTVIGMGTAFTVLLLLTLAITLVGRLVGCWSPKATGELGSGLGGPASDARDRALAAVVAVATVLGKGGTDDTPGSASARSPAVPTDKVHRSVKE